MLIGQVHRLPFRPHWGTTSPDVSSCHLFRLAIGWEGVALKEYSKIPSGGPIPVGLFPLKTFNYGSQRGKWTCTKQVMYGSSLGFLYFAFSFSNISEVRASSQEIL